MSQEDDIGGPRFREPTDDECSETARVGDGWACWYPQMGGYVAKAVVVPNENGGCFEVYVWHCGTFPFGFEDQPPRALHHCDPQQFIDFGAWAKTLPGMEEDPD